MKKRFVALFLAFVLVCTLLAGCASKTETPAKTETRLPPKPPRKPQPKHPLLPRLRRKLPLRKLTPAPKKIKIGFSVSGFDNENFVYMDQLMSKYCSGEQHRVPHRCP